MSARAGSRLRPTAAGVLFGMVVAVVGCAQSDRPMIEVSGKVSLDGVAVEDGQILFRRTSGERRGYEGQIKQGAYKLMCEPGEVKAEVTAYRPVPGKFTTVNGPKEPVTEMYIPEKYNSQTTLVVQLDGAGNSVNFELTSK